jgi:hypothetical protein
LVIEPSPCYDVAMKADTTTVSLSVTIVIALLSGLAGALIPLIVQPYFNHRRKLYDRTRKHVDSLIKLELRLLDIDASLHDNKIAFKFIVDGYKAKQVSIQRLIPLELELSFFEDSFSGELNNRLYQFRYDLRRINNDIANFNHNYDILTKAVLMEELAPAKIAEKLGGLLVDDESLRTGFEELQDHCQTLLAYSKLRARKDRVLLMKYRSWILQRRVKKVTDEEVSKEKQDYLEKIIGKK